MYFPLPERGIERNELTSSIENIPMLYTMRRPHSFRPAFTQYSRSFFKLNRDIYQNIMTKYKYPSTQSHIFVL